MIKNLQNRLLITLTAILTLFFWSILFIINFQNFRLNINQSLDALHRLEQPSKQERPSPEPDGLFEKEPDKIRNFLSACMVFYDGNEYEVSDMNYMTDFSEKEILSAARQIVETKKEEGRWKNFLYLNRNGTVKNTLYLMDISPALERIKNMFFFSLFLGILGFILLFGIALVLSRWLVKPVSLAFTRQKQFISDASHELKTPLTVVAANAEMLEAEVGDNKWLSYIQSETKRMNRLVNELLSLARIENQTVLPVFSSFSLSNALISVLLPFESIAFEQGTCLTMDIEESVSFTGCEEQLKQVVSILTDNALRHSTTEGTVNVILKKQHRKIKITVSNTGEPIPEQEQERIFDRFYRSDVSRERSEGRYGLGLAIAKAITEQHNGRIFVQCENGWTSFCVELPVKS